MPELPDIEMFRKEAEKCMNNEIESFSKSDSRFVKLSENEFDKSLKGRKFIRVDRRGKYLFMITDKGKALILHFGMTGNLHCIGSSEEEPNYTRCSFRFKNNQSLHIISRRKLGYVDLTENVESWIKEKELGPDALDLRKDEFLSAIRSRKSMIKTVLTDQTILSGIGNEYADEILFQAKIHPKESSDRIPGKELEKLFNVVQKVLKTAVDLEADVSKLPGNFLLPVRSKGNNCPSCNSKIETTKISGRTTYYCPSCQKSSGK